LDRAEFHRLGASRACRYRKEGIVTRNLMGLAAAVALLGSGYGPRSVQAVDDWDEESRMKRKALEDACLREREEMRLAANRRLQERARRAVEAKIMRLFPLSCFASSHSSVSRPKASIGAVP
jgi:hypothetical protein